MAHYESGNKDDQDGTNDNTLPDVLDNVSENNADTNSDDDVIDAVRADNKKHSGRSDASGSINGSKEQLHGEHSDQERKNKPEYSLGRTLEREAIAALDSAVPEDWDAVQNEQRYREFMNE